MRSFKQFFEDYIKESPDQGGNNELFDDKTDEELGIHSIINSDDYTNILNIPKYDVSLWQLIDGDDIIIQFINNTSNESAGSVTFEKFEDGGVKITSVTNKSNYKGLAYWVYINYLLKKYSYIMSDGKHSKMGELFWKKIVDLNLDMYCSVWEYFDPNRKKYIKDIKNSSEMEEYYGQSGYHNYVFVISNN
jgi:hypothetical protein